MSRASLFLFLLVIHQNVISQEKNAAIQGTILDPSNQPSQYSTVVLMNQDSVFIKGTLSLDDGSFTFDKMNAGNYLVMIRNVEFNTYVSKPLTLHANEILRLDKISLETKVAGLAEVVIKGEKAMVEVHADKMVYNVANSANASGNNGLELLSKAPGVMVDLDKNIVLQGKSDVKIYINGRPSRLSGSDLSNMLESLRSDNIEAIDIISNPGAKYEAEGAGGIINIILKRSTDRGFNGNFIANLSTGMNTDKSLGTTLNYSSEKIGAYASIDLTDENWQDDFIQTTLREEYLLDLETENHNNLKGLNLSAGIDYKLNSENTLSFDIRALLNDRHNALESNTYIKDLNEQIATERLYSEVLDVIPSNNTTMNLHYSYVPNKSSSFSSDISLGSYTNSAHTQQPNTYYRSSDNTELRSVNSEYDAETLIDMMSAKIDYEKQYNRLSFSTGAKYAVINTDNTLLFYDIPASEPILNRSRSNDFTYLEKVLSAYVTLNGKVSENLSINAGIRAENTSSVGELHSEISTENDLVSRNYTSWFPNVSIAYNDQQTHAISISIGRRITRPNYHYLNPFESKLSELSAWKGNPFLKPNYITNYQVSYSLKRKLVISNNYSVTHDYFATIFEAVDEKSSILTPRNMQRVINNGLSISYPLQVTDWWEFSSFFIYNHAQYNGELNATIIDLTANIFTFRMQNNIKLPWDASMEISYYGRSPFIWRGSVEVEEFHDVSIGIKREFFKKTLLVQINATDILRTSSDFYYTSNYGGLIIDGVRTFDNQRVGASLTYKFGNQKLKRSQRKKSAIDEELQRIAE